MYFHGHLDKREVTDISTLADVTARKSALGHTPFGALGRPRAVTRTPQPAVPVLVSAGDVVMISVEQEGPWSGANDTSFAYVQSVF